MAKIKRTFWLMSLMFLLPFTCWAQISENFQSWTTSSGAYITLNQSGSGGTWTGTSVLVAPTGAASGTGSSGYAQLQGGAGILNLPTIASGGIGTLTFTMRVSSTSSAGVDVEKYNGTSWVLVQSITTGLSTTAATYNVTINDNSANLKVRLNDGAYARADYFHDISTTVAATPVITTSGSLAAVNTTYGTASASPTSFTVSGTNMTAGITVTPPAGYEVSKTSISSGYAGSGTAITVGSSGTISNTTVYVRLASTATVAGSPYSGNIVCSSSGATSKNVATVSSTLSAAALSITASAQSKTYGTALSLGTTLFGSSGLVAANGDAISGVTLTSTGTAATANVGSYNIVPSSATGTGLSNYTITYNNGTLTVNPKALTVTANNQSKCQGATFSFAGTEFSTSGLVNSDVVSSATITSTGAPSGATAGSYSIVPSVATGTGLGNYTISYSNGSFTVNPSVTPSVTIVASPAGAVCAGTTVTITPTPTNGGSPTYQWSVNNGATTSGATFSSSSFVNGDVVRCTMTSTAACASPTTVSPVSNVTVSVNPLPANPTGSITVAANPACGSTTLSFPAGTGGVTNYWQTVNNGQSNSLATNGSANYTVSASGTYYVQAYNGCWSSGSLATSSSITINTAVAITTHPSNATVITPSSASFNIAASGTVASYKWQVNTGSGWVDLTNTSPYSGALTNTLTINPTSTAMTGYQYRCIALGTSPCANATSNAATLTVTSAPVTTGTYPFTGTASITGPAARLVASSVAGNLSFSSVSTNNLTIQSSSGNDDDVLSLSPSSGNFGSSINTSNYIQFTVTPSTGYLLTCTSLTFSHERTGAGATNYSVRSSADGYAADLSTGTTSTSYAPATVSLSGAAFTSQSTATTFRIYPYGGSSTGFWRVDDITLYGIVDVSCTSPDALQFVQQPSNVVQDVAMSPAVTVKAICSSTGNIAGNYTGNITLTATNNGCGYVSQTVAAVNGIATFSNIVFTRSAQTGIKLQATASGLTSATSNTFNVTTPAGSPGTTTIVSENFEGATQWSYSVGTATYSQSGGTTNGDYVGIKTFSSNHALVKSYTADNAAGQTRSTNTITFSNKTGLSAYSYVTFSFQIGSLGSGTGAGNDTGDDMLMQISLDGGSTWSNLLTYYGFSDYLFALSASSPSPVSLAYNSNASYNYDLSNSSTQSAFSVVLPSGTSQFQFRIKATNNRTNENWTIDNIQLIGTTIAAGVPRSLPTVSISGGSTTSCPNSSVSLSAVPLNAIGTVAYAWSPNTSISNTTVSNPTVNPATALTYTVVITDNDGCTATSSQAITFPSGSTGSWNGTVNTDWFECVNWGGGVVPTSATDVSVLSSAARAVVVDPSSTFATGYSGIATARNITVDNKTLSTVAGSGKLTVAGNLTVQNSGIVDMTQGGTLEITGNLTGTGGTFTGGAGTVSFVNAGTSTITLGSGSFNILNINKTSGSKVTLSSNITVSNVLNGNTGIFEVPSGKIATVNLLSNTSTGTINMKAGGRMNIH